MINLIFACDLGGCIGSNGTLPWHIPEDLGKFQRLTYGSVVLMGRKTWESLPKKPLANRENIILSTQKLHSQYLVPNTHFCSTMTEALSLHQEKWASKPLYIIGGKALLDNFIHLGKEGADQIFMTLIHTHVENGDTYLNPIDLTKWQITYMSGIKDVFDGQKGYKLQDIVLESNKEPKDIFAQWSKHATSRCSFLDHF
jgi:dihydrofolate reductase